MLEELSSQMPITVGATACDPAAALDRSPSRPASVCQCTLLLL